jgi:hypothetical protein
MDRVDEDSDISGSGAPRSPPGSDSDSLAARGTGMLKRGLGLLARGARLSGSVSSDGRQGGGPGLQRSFSGSLSTSPPPSDATMEESFTVRSSLSASFTLALDLFFA